MSNVNVSGRRSVEWKEIARLFYDFDSGEVLPLSNDSGITEIAIQMGICARLFQNGFEEDANAVWQRMISHTADTEQRECSSALDTLCQEEASGTTQREGNQRRVTLRVQPSAKGARGVSDGTRNSNTSLQNEHEIAEQSEFDLFGTEQSNNPEMSSEPENWSTDS